MAPTHEVARAWLRSTSGNRPAPRELWRSWRRRFWTRRRQRHRRRHVGPPGARVPVNRLCCGWCCCGWYHGRRHGRTCTCRRRVSITIPPWASMRPTTHLRGHRTWLYAHLLRWTLTETRPSQLRAPLPQQRLAESTTSSTYCSDHPRICAACHAVSLNEAHLSPRDVPPSASCRRGATADDPCGDCRPGGYKSSSAERRVAVTTVPCQLEVLGRASARLRLLG